MTAVHPGRAAARLVFVVLLALPFAAAGKAAEPDSLAVVTASGRHAFTVEIAATPDQRARGLMFRRRLARDAGMLFDYGRERRVAMWMKNTFIPLDMLFIAADGRIVGLAERTVPRSLTPIASAAPVRAVLEINAGTVARLGIEPGDRVDHAIFRGAE